MHVEWQAEDQQAGEVGLIPLSHLIMSIPCGLTGLVPGSVTDISSSCNAVLQAWGPCSRL
jgi:hypothetical protein